LSQKANLSYPNNKYGGNRGSIPKEKQFVRLTEEPKD
jgi:hypothetical protein